MDAAEPDRPRAVRALQRLRQRPVRGRDRLGPGGRCRRLSQPSRLRRRLWRDRRDRLRAPGRGVERFDLVLDLSAEPLLKRVELPTATPRRGATFEQALAVQAGRIRRRVRSRATWPSRPALCAHSRAKKTGCTNCIEACATGAIRSNGDVIAVDPWLCKGCGTCSTVCPSGAAVLPVSACPELGQRVKTLLVSTRAPAAQRCLPAVPLPPGRHRDHRAPGAPRSRPAARVIPVEVWAVRTRSAWT